MRKSKVYLTILLVPIIVMILSGILWLDFSNWSTYLFLILIYLGSVVLFIGVFLGYIFIFCLIHKNNSDYLSPKITRFYTMCCRFVIDFFRIKIHVSGIENIPSTTFVGYSNHQEIFDIPISKKYIDLPVGYMGKIELMKTPLIGRIFTILGSEFLKREDPRDAIKVIKEITDKVNNGLSYIIYPEGTRAHSNDLGEYKHGAFKIALKTKKPILPIVLYDVPEIKKNFPLHRSHVYLSYLKPIYFEEYEMLDTKELSIKVENLVKDEMEVLKGVKNARNRN